MFCYLRQVDSFAACKRTPRGLKVRDFTLQSESASEGLGPVAVSGLNGGATNAAFNIQQMRRFPSQYVPPRASGPVRKCTLVESWVAVGTAKGMPQWKNAQSGAVLAVALGGGGRLGLQAGQGSPTGLLSSAWPVSAHVALCSFRAGDRPAKRFADHRRDTIASLPLRGVNSGTSEFSRVRRQMRDRDHPIGVILTTDRCTHTASSPGDAVYTVIYAMHRSKYT